MIYNELVNDFSLNDVNMFKQKIKFYSNEVDKLLVDNEKLHNDLREFYSKRNLKSTFSLPRHKTINISIKPPGSGTVKINSLNIDQAQWSGDYFPGIPINISAHPKPGLKFKEWTGAPDSLSSGTHGLNETIETGASQVD